MSTQEDLPTIQSIVDQIGFVLTLAFSTGETLPIDFEPLLKTKQGPVWEPLKTSQGFSEAYIHPRHHFLTWPGEQVTLASEALLELAQEQKQEFINHILKEIEDNFQAMELKATLSDAISKPSIANEIYRHRPKYKDSLSLKTQFSNESHV